MLPVTLAKVFRDSRLIDVSPDGSLACMAVNRREDELRILELGSWKSFYSLQLKSQIGNGGFFGDGGRVYVEALGGKGPSQHVVVDLRTRQFDERLTVYAPDESIFYRPLDGSDLLGHVLHRRGDDALIRAELPEYKEVRRLPWPGGLKLATQPSVSPDRKTFVYRYDSRIVCRNMEDFGVLWTRTLEPGFLVGRTVVSAPGGRVAAIVATDLRYFGNRPPTGTYYLDILDGRDGGLQARVPVAGDFPVSLSWDGRMFAMGRPISDPKSGVTSEAAQIYEIDSHHLLAQLVHDRHHFTLLPYNGPNCVFTPGDRYLITSAVTTKIWDLHRPAAP